MRLEYDLHTHILPGIDDGAKTVEDAVSLIESLFLQGVKNICLTPHFYSHKENMKDFLHKREEAYREIAPYIPEYVNIKLGAEVYVTEYLFAQDKGFSELCIEGTPYMITEFSYNSTFTSETMRQIMRLRDMGITPIIPHVERYPNLIRNNSLLEELIYMGIIIQANCVSFTDLSHRRRLLRLLKSGHIHILSTDVHSFTRNSPATVKQAMEVITKKLSSDIYHYLNNNARDVFEGR